MRYTKKVQKIEKDTDPFVLQWFWDTFKKSFNVYDIRNYDPNKIKTLKNKILCNEFKNIDEFYDIWSQYIIENIILDYQIDGIDKIFQIIDPASKEPNMIIDAKGTHGYRDKTTGLWVPSYGKVTMELCHRYLSMGDDKTVHRPSYPYLRSNRTGWEDDIKYILFISKLLAILIPKVPLNEVLNDPKYAYKFDVTNKPWEKNPRDTKDDRLVKNVRFDLGYWKDLNIFLKAKSRFYLRNNAGIYVPFHPKTDSFKKIEQNYLQHTSRTIKNKL